MTDFKGQTKLLINNEWVDAVSGKTFPTINPTDGSVITYVAEADKADVDKAVKAARTAFQKWRNSTPRERALLLNRFADLLEKHTQEIAELESLGMSQHSNRFFFLSFFSRLTDELIINRFLQTTESLSRLLFSMSAFQFETFRYYAGWTDKITGQTIPVGGDVSDFLKYCVAQASKCHFV